MPHLEAQVAAAHHSVVGRDDQEEGRKGGAGLQSQQCHVAGR